MHVDLDAFYASVEQRLRPGLRGRPVIVGGSGEPGSRGVVCAASYEARRFGIHSAMPLVRARRLCPDGIFLPANFPEYRRHSADVFDILHDYSPTVEPLALDEAYLDLTGSEPLLGPPRRVAETIRDRVEHECGLPISIGVGSSKLVAKIASGLQKPRGLVVVPVGGEAAFVQALPVGQLPGLGPAAAARLEGLGIRTVAALARLPLTVLEAQFGAAGPTLRDFAHGIDPRPVLNPGPPKSISRETTFDRDTRDAALLEATLRQLTLEVAAALRRARLLARTLALKLRYQPFDTLSRQCTLPEASDEDALLLQASAALLCAHRDPARAVRLLGVGVQNLVAFGQLSLLARRGPARIGRAERTGDLDRRLDALRTRYGPRAITRGPTQPLAQRDFRREDLDAVLHRAPKAGPLPP